LTEARCRDLWAQVLGSVHVHFSVCPSRFISDADQHAVRACVRGLIFVLLPSIGIGSVQCPLPVDPPLKASIGGGILSGRISAPLLNRFVTAHARPNNRGEAL